MDKSAGRFSPATGLCIVLIPFLFLTVSSYNLFFPFPTGPADNGDFTRIFASFSTGPIHCKFWPPQAERQEFRERFFNYYHRFWRHDEGKSGFVHTSSSRFCFWPGRLFGTKPGAFDLAWNAFLLLLATSAVLCVCLRKTKDLCAVLSLGTFAVLMSDVNIAGYVNSFYQESGLFLSFLILIFALHVFFVRRSRLVLSVVSVITLMLAATKVTSVPSVLVCVPLILTGIAFLSPGAAHRRRGSVVAAIMIVIFSLLVVKITISTPGDERRANCYHLVFAGAIPRLDPEQGKVFLRRIGLDSSLVILGGKNAYEADSRYGTLRPFLTTNLQARAVTALAVHYPRAFLDLMGYGFSRAGYYELLADPPLNVPKDTQPPFKWDGWTRLHRSLFHGGASYLTVSFLMVILGIAVRAKRESGWPLFHLILAASFFPAAILQIFISVLGNGPVDIDKHHYFANLLLDAALIFAVAGLVELGSAYRKKRGGLQEIDVPSDSCSHGSVSRPNGRP